MDRYLAQRAELLESAAPGLDSARRLASLTDEALRRLIGMTDPPSGRWCVMAVGGYGAGALLPSSDIDLLVLSDSPPATLGPFCEGFLYPLWDASLKVGHQVRSPRDHFRVARDDLTVFTATLTARPIAGDAELGRAVARKCASVSRRSRTRIGRDIAARPRPGSPYLLEPDLKEGAGGRRDFDELVWHAALTAGRPCADLGPLVEADLLSTDERALVESAAEFVAAARWEIASLGNGTRLTLDAAASISTPAEHVQLALGDTAHVLDRVRRRMDTGTASESPTQAAGPLSAEQVFELLAKGEAGLSALEEAAWSGGFSELIPQMRALMPLRRPALSHTHTVGAHSLRTAALAATLGTGSGTLGPLARSRESLASERTLLIAALTHDTGKMVAGAGHPERGAPVARDAAVRFGLTSDEARDAEDLVRLHLTLAETAASENLDDEDTLLRTAERIGRRELLAPLHLLTVADSLATGPGAWGPWHEALVDSLVSRLDVCLDPSRDAPGIAEEAEKTRAAAAATLPAEAPASAHRFVTHASLRYLAGRTPEQVAHDAALVARLDPNRPGDAELSVGIGPIEGTRELSVAAFDQPELMARLAGALALSGLDILSADAFAAGDGVALDVFLVRSATLAAIDHEVWARLERYVRAALADRLELETRLAERRRHYPARVDAAATVVTDASAGIDTTVLVTAADRVGLLYDIVRAISSVGLDIRWAKAVTAEGIARDAFHVVGPDGQAPTDPGLLGHLAMRIRERIQRPQGYDAPERCR